MLQANTFYLLVRHAPGTGKVTKKTHKGQSPHNTQTSSGTCRTQVAPNYIHLKWDLPHTRGTKLHVPQVTPAAHKWYQITYLKWDMTHTSGTKLHIPQVGPAAHKWHQITHLKWDLPHTWHQILGHESGLLSKAVDKELSSGCVGS